MANFTGKIIGVTKTTIKKLNGLEPTINASLKSVNTKPYLPGFSWESALSVPSGNWDSVAYGNGTFVAIDVINGNTQSVMTSPNGLTWTLQTTPSGKRFSRVIYGGGLFVAVGYRPNPNEFSTSQIMTSPDGITWTLQTHPSTIPSNIAYGNGIYVVLNEFGSSTDVLVSSDGITWVLNSAVLPFTSNFRQIHFYNGYFIYANFSGNQVYYSIDGINWNNTSLSTSGNFRAISWASSGPVAGLYVLGSLTSTDKQKSTSIATTFSSVDNIGPNRLSSLVYCDISAVFVGIEALTNPGVGVQRITTSSSADVWTGRSGITSRGQAITYGDNKLVIVGNNFASISY